MLRQAPHPYARDIAREALDVHEETFEGSGGAWIFTRSWRPRTPVRAALVVVHGLKDHGARYDDLATRMAAHGHAVYALDHQGHGRSDGAPQYVDDFHRYVDDVATLVARVRAREGAVPVFVLGHSMGGAIATLYVLDHPRDVQGLILSAPALATDAGAVTRGGARFLGAVAPGAGALALDESRFCHDPAVYEAMQRDPLVHHERVPARTAVGLLDAIARIQRDMEQITVPLLVMHGTADEITVPAGSDDLARRARSADRTRWRFTGAWHDLLHEPNRDAIMNLVRAWVDAHAVGATPNG